MAKKFKPRQYSFLHAGTIGDVWAAFPAMRQYYRRTGNKVILYLWKDAPAEYPGALVHPTKNEEGKMVMLNGKMIEMMIPLIQAQPWIDRVEVWNNQPIDIDLNKIRTNDVGMPGLSINRWYFYIFPDLACDLSEKWMEVPDTDQDFCRGKILINRTERYLIKVGQVSYAFLKDYEDDCVFVGTMREYNQFCMGFDLNIRKLTVNNFLEYAQAIKQSKFYMSNQSQGFQIAEGLKHPRSLEACVYAPNVIPIGGKAYDSISGNGIEWNFHMLNGSEDAYAEKIRARYGDNLGKFQAAKEKEKESREASLVRTDPDPQPIDN